MIKALGTGLGLPGETEARTQPESAEKPWKVLQYVWKNIPVYYLIKLQGSVPTVR